MKISINWMLDHILTPTSKLDVGLIVAKFNVHTAEIESYEKSELDVQNLFLVRLISCDQNSWTVRCDELNQTIQLSLRNDLQLSQLALVRRKGDLFTWEMLQKYSATKEGLFPAVDCPDHLIAGGWKQDCEELDYIVDVDNKSINHRPDLWGHRGIASEVAAFMGWQLKPLDSMLAHIKQVDYPEQSKKSADSSVVLEITDTTACYRLSALYCAHITHKASQIWMAMRLARVDCKPINSIIDITNYVMFDLSQPMHVFDAANFPDKKLQVRAARSGESLELLDGHQLNFTQQDFVVTDGTHPVELAGVMGGKQASFSNKAQAIIIEAGSFNAAMIRHGAARVKVTTEASTRFTKQLDPMQNVSALRRFVFIAEQLGVVEKVTEKIVSVGKIIEPSVIAVSHAFIETRLGMRITTTEIVALLHKLGFAVDYEHNNIGSSSIASSVLGFLEKNKVIDVQDVVYHVTVPTLRTSKDIAIPEDIVEEIARLYGYQNISYARPVRAMKSFDTSSVMKLRKIKEYCAFSMNMREVRDYLFYDESFLKRLGWYPTDAGAIKNPVSENWKVLVTSLIPHLIKNVEFNIPGHEQINFFEHNNVWSSCANPAVAKAMADLRASADAAQVSSTESIESKSLAGIFFGHKNMNFYDYKAQLQGFFAMLGLQVVWANPATSLEPWFDQFQTADMVIEGVKIGRAGMLCNSLVRSVVKGQGFVFELSADLLFACKPAEKKFVSWSKYQAVHVDISMLVDTSTSSEIIEKLIVGSDTKIDQVHLLDFFEKEEWAGKRSLTFRYRICDFEQNLTKEIIEQVTDKVVQNMIMQGAQVR